MNYITKTTHTTNYTVLSNAHLANSDLSGDALKALNYLLSRPLTWKMRVTDLQRVLSRCRKTVYKILKQLRDHGYAVLRRSYRKSEWFFSEIPIPPQIHQPSTPPVESHSGNIYCGTKYHYLGSKESFLVSKKNIPQPPVVVSLEEEIQTEQEPLVLPDNLPTKHHKQAKASLSKIDVQQAALVLTVLSGALKKGGINNPIAYLHGLINASQAGTLTEPAQEVKQKTGRDYDLEQKAREKAAANESKINNEDWAAKMEAQYPDSFKGLVVTAKG